MVKYFYMTIKLLSLIIENVLVILPFALYSIKWIGIRSTGSSRGYYGSPRGYFEDFIPTDSNCTSLHFKSKMCKVKIIGGSGPIFLTFDML